MKGNFVVDENTVSLSISEYDPRRTLVFDPSIVWAPYYGGSGEEFGQSTAVDASGNVFLAGRTASTSGIASGGFQNTYGGGTYDAFLVKFSSSGSRTWATYYGGTGDDQGTSTAVDASGNVFLAGQTASTSGIASGGFQNTYGGGTNDAFLVKSIPRVHAPGRPIMGERVVTLAIHRSLTLPAMHILQDSQIAPAALLSGASKIR